MSRRSDRRDELDLKAVQINTMSKRVYRYEEALAELAKLAGIDKAYSTEDSWGTSINVSMLVDDLLASAKEEAEYRRAEEREMRLMGGQDDD